jgi:hypothetical protein
VYLRVFWLEEHVEAVLAVGLGGKGAFVLDIMHNKSVPDYTIHRKPVDHYCHWCRFCRLRPTLSNLNSS